MTTEQICIGEDAWFDLTIHDKTSRVDLDLNALPTADVQFALPGTGLDVKTLQGGDLQITSAGKVRIKLTDTETETITKGVYACWVKFIDADSNEWMVIKGKPHFEFISNPLTGL